MNSILDTDSYKASHFLQTPPQTKGIFSYLEAREGAQYDNLVWFGLQSILHKLAVPVTTQDVEEAHTFFTAHGEPFPYEGWKQIVKDYGGRLPVHIRALPEGSVVPVGTPLLTIENTDERFPWLTNWLETRLMRSWYPSTVATVSWYAKYYILKSLIETSDDPYGEIDFKLHDFGSRGVSSEESAAMGGAAHLANFKGSDTVVGIMHANKYYKHSMAGFSIPAMEHSTVIAWGKDGEADAYRNMLRTCGRPGGIIACVSDSYNLYNAVRHIWGGTLRDEVIKSGCTVVVRPDSGDFMVILPDMMHILADKFGYTINSKKYRVLNHVRVLQGDGIDSPDVIKNILDTINHAGYSTSNIAFGMGGGLLQKCNRDTQRFALKASAIKIDNTWHKIGKSPKTDPTKSSKQGRLDVRSPVPYKYETVYHNAWDSAMSTVFRDGEFMDECTLDQVRARTMRHMELVLGR